MGTNPGRLVAYAYAEEALAILEHVIEGRTWLPDRRRVFPVNAVDTVIHVANALTIELASLRATINGEPTVSADLTGLASLLQHLNVSDHGSRRDIRRTLGYVQTAASHTLQADQPAR